jgi:hypothetical protein
VESVPYFSATLALLLKYPWTLHLTRSVTLGMLNKPETVLKNLPVKWKIHGMVNETP